MNKRKSIIQFSLIIAVTVIFTVFAFLPIKGVKNYLAFPGGIKANSTDSSVSGGMYAVYELRESKNTASKAKFKEQVDARRWQLIYALSEEYSQSGLGGLNVEKLSNNRLLVEITSLTTTQGSVGLADIISTVERPHDLVFKAGENVILYGKSITNVYLQNNTQAQVREMVIVLDDEGEDVFSDDPGEVKIVDRAAEGSGGTDTDVFTIAAGKAAGNRIIVSLSTEEDYIAYYRILSLSRPLELVLQDAGIQNVDSGTKTANLIYIGGAAALVLILLFFALRYRLTGLMGIVAMLGYVSILLFLLALLPFVRLSAAGLSMIIFTMILAAGSMTLAYERIKDESLTGKSIQASIATGYRRSFWPIFDIHAVSLIAGLVMWIAGEGVMGGIGTLLFVGALISMFTSLVLGRYLLNLLVNIRGEGQTPGPLALKQPEGYREETAIQDDNDAPAPLKTSRDRNKGESSKTEVSKDDRAEDEEAEDVEDADEVEAVEDAAEVEEADDAAEEAAEEVADEVEADAETADDAAEDAAEAEETAEVESEETGDEADTAEAVADDADADKEGGENV